MPVKSSLSKRARSSSARTSIRIVERGIDEIFTRILANISRIVCVV